ncbi:chorismate-binding protein [Aquimarina agarivorans]|uniref:chorismate-binding protein n=1 Tax=Aquimarina agarivorans TaxID=980584 RepID=UPI000248EAFE|nr:chorismate-binding protein [Aquimarina agarivorans]
MTFQLFFDKLNDHWNKELPFVVFKKPNRSTVSAYLNHSNQLILGSGFDKPGFVFSPFTNTDNDTIWFTEDSSEIIHTKQEVENSEKNQSLIIQSNFSNHEKKAHITTIKKALFELKAGRLQKVIISRVETLKLNQIDPFSWFKKMTNLYSNAFCYCWYHPKVGMWLGATPETLISLKKTSFDTIALAGTMVYKGTTNVSWGAKEIEEQQLVVDSMQKALAPIAKSLKKGETETQKAGSLLHLKTAINGTLNSVKQLGDLVSILHPTSAICGLPKQQAKAFILANEGYSRMYYTGYLGEYKPEGNTQLFVNLRCMQIEGKEAKIYVGGGITKASDPHLEWEETVNKSQIMKAVL